jgi:type III restriction enzyme
VSSLLRASTAIDSITGIFRGQEICRTNFTVAPLQVSDQPELIEYNQGVGNRIKLLPEDILENVRNIQLRNGLAPSEKLDGMNFTVEMETGTGKTYVYLRSIFELNQQYGFTKFIIVVPSVAIKEGVYKSLQMTEEHLKGLYDNVQYDYFIYDSQKLGQVRSFATNDYIQIMVINIDAFRKSFKDPEKEDKANIIHRPHDRMAGTRPIEFIKDTSPIVIIDEPQSVDTTEKSKEAIQSLNPLCTLRYSATHVDKYNMLFKLDSVDAYERKLVKQIEVSSLQITDSHNKPYIKLLKTDNRKSPITAKIEMDIKQKDGTVKRTQKKVRQGDDLFDLSGGRDVYEGYIIDDIYSETGNEYINFTSKPDIAYLNTPVGGVDDDEYKQLQIRKTIETHLDKEMKLRRRGIKVLSLFFIDRVRNYRWYDEEGSPRQGKYARMFEEEYQTILQKNPKYHTLFEDVDVETAAEGVHDGYFAIDKKKDASGNARLKDSTGEGKTQADESAYHMIMQNKEKLLGFESRLKFIFSHSALKEGWDNPNVFQICTLNETSSTMKKRQEIGRGLRIAVNQDGERVHGFDVNTLTVMANESYEDFARQLQSEIEQEEGIRFGVVEKHLFAGIAIATGDHTTEYLGVETSNEIWTHLAEHEYIDTKGKVQDKLKQDLKNNQVSLPESAQQYSQQVLSLLKKVSGDLNIKNADDKKRVNLNKKVFLGEEFKALWDKVKYKTTFRVDFDVEKLITACAAEIKNNLVVGKTRFYAQTAKFEIDRGGVKAGEVKELPPSIYSRKDYQLPDIISYLQNETNLTRKAIVDILVKSEKLDDFPNNPQKFIEQVATIVKHQMQVFIVDGIKYQKLGEDHYYAQELFEENELFGYLKKNMIEAEKSVFDHVVYDSDVEAEFAKSFEKNDLIKVYAKLPGWFTIDTPLGPYNPDWAVLVELEGEERLYFVVETKGSLFTDALRKTEEAKINCGREHFKALRNEVKFTFANNFDSFADKIFS